MLTDLGARLTHWKTTGAGVAAAAAVYAVMQSLGCTVPSDWRAWAVTAIPAVLGALAK